MQASKVSVGEAYGVHVHGKLRALRVHTTIQEKSQRGTTNFAAGWYTNDDGGRTEVKLPVADLIDDYDTLQELAKRRAEDVAKKEAAESARVAKQQKAINLLAKAIDAKPVFGGRYDKDSGFDRDAPMVSADFTAIEINDHAFDGLIKFLEGESGQGSIDHMPDDVGDVL